MERVHIPAHDMHRTIHVEEPVVASTLPAQESQKVAAVATPLPDTHPAAKLNLDVSQSATEIRRDYLHEYYVLVAPKRKNRPYDTASHDHPMVESADSPRLDLQKSVLEIPPRESGRPWNVKVVENKYPALTLDNPVAYGQQELVIDTPLSNVAFGSLDPGQISTVLQAYRQRSVSIKQNKHIAYVSIFRNDGYEAGASLAHAHSQIIALPIVPPQIVREAEACAHYYEHFQNDPFDAIIDFERSKKVRLIAENVDWIAFCPYASQWQMEAWILPKRTISVLDDCDNAILSSAAELLAPITRALTDTDISYNLIVDQGIHKNQRLTLKVCGRNVVSPWGGLEVGTGMIVNVIPPEAAATWYQQQAL